MKRRKTVRALVVGALGKKAGPLSLSEIYREVKRYRPGTEESTIRGRINESILNNEKLFKRLGGGVYDVEQ